MKRRPKADWDWAPEPIPPTASVGFIPYECVLCTTVIQLVMYPPNVVCTECHRKWPKLAERHEKRARKARRRQLSISTG